MLTTEAKKKTIQVVNVFETGKPDGAYDMISLHKDGPGKMKQVTYGRSQTTEFGSLKTLVADYVSDGGKYATELKPYLSKIGNTKTPLADDKEFLKFLKLAGKDPIMIKSQDDFFDMLYFQPAKKFWDNAKMIHPLSLLVIYDSYIHSGSIPGFLREKFAAKLPSYGGNEKTWITQYVDTRENWLKGHSNKILRGTIYRTQALKDAIKKNNWDLIQPILANGQIVK